MEVSNRASKKQHQKMLAGAALCRDFQQTVEILALEAQDADGFDITQFSFAHHQRRSGNFDGIVRSSLAAGKGFKNVAGFLTAAAAQFGHRDRRSKPVYDVAAVTAEQTLIGAGGGVFEI